MDGQNHKVCSKCREDFVYKPEETFWDEKGYGYSTKLVLCPYCKHPNVIKYSEDISFDVNKDRRFYK